MLSVIHRLQLFFSAFIRVSIDTMLTLDLKKASLTPIYVLSDF